MGRFTYTYLSACGHAQAGDNNGNMLTKTGSGETWQLTYNTLNQLVQANQNTTTVAYQYLSACGHAQAGDHDGIRVGKTVNGANVTKYLVDNNVPYAQVLEEQWTAGGLSAVTRYTYGDALLAQSTNGVAQFYDYDGLGSTRALTDATGALTDTYAYDAYGQLLAQTGASANAYLYRGEQYDPETEAYYLRARYYQPGIGRFMTTDPVEGFPNAPLSLHRYVYGNDAPINFLDPSGKFTLKETMQVVAIVNVISVTAIALGGWEDTYAALGEGIFPDAFALGVTGSIDGNLPFILSGGGLFGSLITGPHLAYGRGKEVLMSVSSGEIGVFDTSSWNLTFGVAEPLQARADLYKGFVWNLWNVNNYEGHFYSVSISDWVTIFCDAKAAIPARP